MLSAFIVVRIRTCAYRRQHSHIEFARRPRRSAERSAAQSVPDCFRSWASSRPLSPMRYPFACTSPQVRGSARSDRTEALPAGPGGDLARRHIADQVPCGWAAQGEDGLRKRLLRHSGPRWYRAVGSMDGRRPGAPLGARRPHCSMRPAGWKESGPRPVSSSYCRYFSVTTCWACASNASAAFGSVRVRVR